MVTLAGRAAGRAAGRGRGGRLARAASLIYVPEPISELEAAKYALLTTYRRDGRGVETPVWIVRTGDNLAVWTVVSSGKVKRIRREPAVTLATCDIRGNHPGPAYPGRADLLDADGTAQVRRQIINKYGWSGQLVLLGSRLRRGQAGTIGIRITL